MPLGRICQTKLDGLVKTEAETHTKISETYEARPKPEVYQWYHVYCICMYLLNLFYLHPTSQAVKRFVWHVFQGEALEAGSFMIYIYTEKKNRYI